MSDRIEELVAEAEFLNDTGCDKCEIVTQLATIAREAEADRDSWIDRCYQSEERALKAEAMCEWLANLAASNFSRDPSVRRKKADADLHAASEAVAHTLRPHERR